MDYMKEAVAYYDQYNYEIQIMKYNVKIKVKIITSHKIYYVYVISYTHFYYKVKKENDIY